MTEKVGPEVRAIRELFEVLFPLSNEARVRVLLYLVDRFKVAR